MDERIAKQVLVSSKFPKGGRPGRIEGTRELVARRAPSIVGVSVRNGLRSLPANSQ
jgi:hypothetical protein